MYHYFTPTQDGSVVIPHVSEYTRRWGKSSDDTLFVVPRALGLVLPSSKESNEARNSLLALDLIFKIVPLMCPDKKAKTLTRKLGKTGIVKRYRA